MRPRVASNRALRRAWSGIRNGSAMSVGFKAAKGTDHLATIGTAAIQRIGRIQFFPHPQRHAVGAIVGNAFGFQLCAARDCGSRVAPDKPHVLSL